MPDGDRWKDLPIDPHNLLNNFKVMSYVCFFVDFVACSSSLLPKVDSVHQVFVERITFPLKLALDGSKMGSKTILWPGGIWQVISTVPSWLLAVKTICGVEGVNIYLRQSHVLWGAGLITNK